MKNFLASLFGLALLITGAHAQTSPGWTQGYVPTPAEWNNAFALKQDYLGSAPLLTNGGVMTGELVTAPSIASSSGFNIPPGVAPTSPVDGDLWTTPSGIFVQVNGDTIGPLTQGAGGSFIGTTPITVSFSGGVVDYACPTCGVTGQPLSQFASTTSAQLAGVISNETGTGLLVFNTGPALANVTVTGSFTATGLVTVADLTNPSVTVNGQTCTLGGACTISASAGTVTYGVTTVAGGAGIMSNATAGGVMQAIAVVPANMGGTGSNNGSFTISLGGNIVTAGAVTHAGAFATTITATATTNSTLPAGTHTLAGLDVAQTFSVLQTFSAGASLGASIGTSLALGGATLGSNALAVNGFSAFNAAISITSQNASALAVGINGATNPALAVDSSTASSATGLSVASRAAGSGVLVSAISSGANEFLSINAKGSGAIILGNVSTGQVQITPPTLLSAALTYGGVTLSNSVTGTGSMVLSANPTITGSFTATGLVTFADMATAAVATTAQYFAGTANTLVPTSVIYSAETTTTFGTTTTFDFSTFINTAVTLTGNISTMTLSNVKAGQAGSITFIQDGTGSRTSVFNAIFKFANGVVPSLSTAAGAIDVLFYSCRSATVCPASLAPNVH